MVLENIGRALSSPIGQGLLAIGTGGLSLIPGVVEQRQIQLDALRRQAAQQQRQQAALQNLPSILSGTNIPAFRREELGSPQAIAQEQQRNLLGALGQISPDILTKQAAAQAFPQQQAAVSPLGKLQQDITGGLIPGGIGQQAVQRAIEPRQPLVSITGQTETERQKARAQASEKRLSTIIDRNFEELEQLENAAIPLIAIKQNLQEISAAGGATGPASGFLKTLQSLGNQIGIKVDIDEASSIEQIEGFANKLAIPLAKSLGVNPTDRDVKIIQSTIASIGKTLDSNFVFVDITQQLLDRKRREVELINNALDEPDLSETGLRRRLAEFRRDNLVRIPLKIPFRREKVVVGERYITPQGVGIWDGNNFIIQ